MNLLDRMLRDHVTPVLEPAGFQKRSRTYRLAAASGDQAVVGFQRSGGSTADAVRFYVNLGVVPVPYLDWLEEGLPGGRPDAGPETGLWQDRLLAPAEVAGEENPWGTDLWLIDGDAGVEACGRRVAAAVTESLPLLNRLLDRREFLALAEDPERPLGVRVGPADVVLRVDDGMSPELEAALAAYEAKDPEDTFVAWARARASRAGNER